MDLGKLMQQAKTMQNNMQQIEKELEITEYTGSAQNGAVKCTVMGDHKVSSLEIDEELFEKENKELVQDMILLAINEAMTKAKEDRDDKMVSIAGGMKIPGLG